MEAMKNRIHRTAPRAAGGLLRRPIVYLAAPVIVAVLGLGVRAAFAMCGRPPGTTINLVSTNGTRVTFRIGSTAVNCTLVRASFTVPPSPNNCETPGSPLFMALSTPVFTGCSITASGASFPATIAASGTWQIGFSDEGPTATLVVPRSGLRITASLLGSACTTTVAPAGPATLLGSWSNATSSATFANQPLPIATSGGFPCPSSTSATFSGTFTTSPSFIYTL